jgi:septal ring factor EnvC (AmiA/AmiB activator)
MNNEEVIERVITEMRNGFSMVNSTIAETNAQLKQTNARLDQTNAKLDDFRAEFNDFRKEVRGDLAGISRFLSASETNVLRLEGRIESAEKRLDKLETRDQSRDQSA